MIRADLEASTPRLWRLIAAVSAAGTVAAAIVSGAAGAAGFAAGALFSAANFWMWHRVVSRIGTAPAPDEGPKKAPVALFALRYLLFALVGYAILRYFGGSFLAALVGCFVAVAAVVLEIVIELIYGT